MKWVYLLKVQFTDGNKTSILQFNTLHDLREYCKANLGKIRVMDEYAGFNPPSLRRRKTVH